MQICLIPYSIFVIGSSNLQNYSQILTILNQVLLFPYFSLNKFVSFLEIYNKYQVCSLDIFLIVQFYNDNPLNTRFVDHQLYNLYDIILIFADLYRNPLPMRIFRRYFLLIFQYL